MSTCLPATIRKGLLNLPGTTPQAQHVAERLLAEDREKHHCFFNTGGLHNHLSHHILAAYDLGASAKLLQTVYDAETDTQRSVDLKNAESRDSFEGDSDTSINAQNWTQFLGHEKLYASYLTLFTEQILEKGVGETIETFIFSPAANDNEGNMLLRLVGGALHPFIQLGYGLEFGSDAMVAQALAQTAVHSAFHPQIFDLRPSDSPSSALPLFAVLREVYDSTIMHPVMPYDPDALLSARFRSALQNGRPDEIKRICHLWHVPVAPSPAEVDTKIAELFWLATLLLTGTGKVGRPPRLDFFLMHILNATLFLPSVLRALPTAEARGTLLRAFLPPVLMYITIRGRPRIDPGLLMSYSATPKPPLPADGRARFSPSSDAIGDANEAVFASPWPAIVEDVLHAPDPHTLKAIRALYYADQHYGTTPAGQVPGALSGGGKETHAGIGIMDGTVFVRAAGVVMDTLGWVSHGQTAGGWDRSALGWDDAWNR